MVGLKAPKMSFFFLGNSGRKVPECYPMSFLSPSFTENALPCLLLMKWCLITLNLLLCLALIAKSGQVNWNN